MKTNRILFALLAVMSISLVSYSAFAYMGNHEGTIEDRPYYSEEVHDELEAAIEARDYDLWISIREENDLPMNGRIFSVIDETNFAAYADMHEAMEDGDTETADALRAELGLGQGRMGQKGGFHNNKAGLKNNQAGFIDADNDGLCDNFGRNIGKGRK
ncbi:MAG: hypothetical protein KKF44_06980 [Nanoarchaeota archaeon]|nr:hypothetical protein [Nanoarchaeota archaeon]